MKKLIAILLALTLIISGCSQDKKPENDKKGEKLIIGGLAPLTGSVAVYGITAANGEKLAIEEINAKGGILGKQVEFLLEDEKGDPAEAVNAYNKLSGKKIVALLGDITSKPSVAVAEVAKGENMPMITPTGTALAITEGRPNVFRVCFTDPYQGKVLANFAKNNLKAKTAAVLTNNSDDYSKGVAKAFVEEAQKLGIEIVSEEGYSDKDKDFRAQLTNIKEKNPDVLLMPDYYETVALIASQAREVGVKSVFIGADGWDGVVAKLDKSAYNVVEGAYFSNHYSVSDKNEKVANFVKNYKKKYNEDPSAFSALAYDGVYLLKQAIEKANSTKKEDIIKALKEIEFSGVTGKLKFDENNNPLKTVTITKIVNGEYKFETLVELKK